MGCWCNFARATSAHSSLTVPLNRLTLLTSIGLGFCIVPALFPYQAHGIACYDCTYTDFTHKDFIQSSDNDPKCLDPKTNTLPLKVCQRSDRVCKKEYIVRNGTDDKGVPIQTKYNQMTRSCSSPLSDNEVKLPLDKIICYNNAKPSGGGGGGAEEATDDDGGDAKPGPAPAPESGPAPAPGPESTSTPAPNKINFNTETTITCECSDHNLCNDEVGLEIKQLIVEYDKLPKAPPTTARGLANSTSAPGLVEPIKLDLARFGLMILSFLYLIITTHP